MIHLMNHKVLNHIKHGDGILKARAKHEAMINGKRYPIRALMMSHMFVEVDSEVNAQDEVIHSSSKL